MENNSSKNGQYWLIALAVLALLFLAFGKRKKTSNDQQQPPSDQIHEIILDDGEYWNNPCDGVYCGPGQRCSGGICTDGSGVRCQDGVTVCPHNSCNCMCPTNGGLCSCSTQYGPNDDCKGGSLGGRLSLPRWLRRDLINRRG